MSTRRCPKRNPGGRPITIRFSNAFKTLSAAKYSQAISRAARQCVSYFLSTRSIASRTSWGLENAIRPHLPRLVQRVGGSPYATCDVAEAGNQLTVRLVKLSQRKWGATDRPYLRGSGVNPGPYGGH